MEGRTDREVLTDRRLVPRNPYELEATKAIVLKHIEAGDIEQKDIDLMNSSYKTVTIASFLGSTLAGGGSYFYMKKRSPNLGLGSRMMVAGGLGMVGSFLGFVVGGVGASMEVQSKMTDPQRKLQVINEIAIESKRAIENARANGLGARPGLPPPPGSLTRQTYDSSSADSRWDAEGDRERKEEFARESTLRSEIGRIEGDSANESRSTSSTSSDTGVRGIARNVKNETGNVWDRIRSGKPGPGANPINQAPVDSSLAGVTGSKTDTRSKEQKEFDEMLERERRGEEADPTRTWK